MEGLGWHVGLSSVELSPFTGAYYSLDVRHCRWAVEAMSERVADQGFRGRVMTADPTVDVLQ